MGGGGGGREGLENKASIQYNTTPNSPDFENVVRVIFVPSVCLLASLLCMAASVLSFSVV
jgi:hypothetical protein